MQGIFAGLVGEAGDPLAVRRPGRVAVGDGGRACQVADIALLGGNGEDFAVRLEYRARAVRREIGVGELPRRDLLEPRTHLREIGRDAHRDGARFRRGEIEQVQRTELFVDDRARTGRGRLQIEAVVFHELDHGARRHVVAEQRGRAGAVGEEIDFVADPERVEIVGVFAGHGRHGRVGQLRDPDGRGFAAPVVLDGDVGVAGPGAAVPAGHVGESGGVGRVGALHAHRHRHLHRKPALDRHGEQLFEARVGLARRAEEDALAVG